MLEKIIDERGRSKGVKYSSISLDSNANLLALCSVESDRKSRGFWTAIYSLDRETLTSILQVLQATPEVSNVQNLRELVREASVSQP